MEYVYVLEEYSDYGASGSSLINIFTCEEFAVIQAEKLVKGNYYEKKAKSEYLHEWESSFGPDIFIRKHEINKGLTMPAGIDSPEGMDWSPYE